MQLEMIDLVWSLFFLFVYIGKKLKLCLIWDRMAVYINYMEDLLNW